MDTLLSVLTTLYLKRPPKYKSISKPTSSFEEYFCTRLHSKGKEYIFGMVEMSVETTKTGKDSKIGSKGIKSLLGGF